DDTQRLSYTSGDRWILRRYEEGDLDVLSFAALRLSPFASLAGYFDPPLDAAGCDDLDAERAYSLENFGAPDPVEVKRARQTLERAGAEPAERARAALALAAGYDGMLWKEEAWAAIEPALAASQASPDLADARAVETARRLVRRAVAVFEGLAAARLA